LISLPEDERRLFFWIRCGAFARVKMSPIVNGEYSVIDIRDYLLTPRP